MKNIIFVFIFLNGVFLVAQKPAHLRNPFDSLNPDAFVNAVQQSLNLFYSDYANDLKYDSIIN